MPGTFVPNVERIITKVGGGILTAKVEFNQVYAHRQHYELGWKHPRGGEALYLANALFGGVGEYLGLIAGSVDADLDPTPGMIEVAEALARKSASNAPIMWGNLRMSNHPSVTHNGMLIYDRLPIMPRLTDEELDELHELWEDLHPLPWPSEHFFNHEHFANPFKA